MCACGDTLNQAGYGARAQGRAGGGRPRPFATNCSSFRYLSHMAASHAGQVTRLLTWHVKWEQANIRVADCRLITKTVRRLYRLYNWHGSASSRPAASEYETSCAIRDRLDQTRRRAGGAVCRASRSCCVRVSGQGLPV
jgi:hypothetical protein